MAYNTWYLGNMFLDRYFVINDFETADQKKGIMPRIGVYDKWDPINDNWVPPSESSRSDPSPTDGESGEET